MCLATIDETLRPLVLDGRAFRGTRTRTQTQTQTHGDTQTVVHLPRHPGA